MNIEKMREEFEAWSANHEYLGGVEIDRAFSGNYSDVDMHHAWESWKASRESLVIDLGTMTNNGYDGFYPANQIKRALRDAGVKAK